MGCRYADECVVGYDSLAFLRLWGFGIMWMLYDPETKNENNAHSLISKIKLFGNTRSSAPSTAQSTFFEIDSIDDMDQDMRKAA